RRQAAGRDGACPRVLRKHQGLDPAPQLVLVCLAPDTAHLRQGVPLDHVLYPALTLVAAPAAVARAASGRSYFGGRGGRRGAGRCPPGPSRRASGWPPRRGTP